MSILLARIAVVIAVTAAPLSVARAQNGAPTPASKLHAVSGTVADKQGNPVSSAEVALIERDTVGRRAMTDLNGRFRIDAVPAGTLQLRVRHAGFQISHVTVDPSPLDRSVFIALDPIDPAANATKASEQDTAKALSPRLAEFYARARSNRLGYFIDEQRLNDLRPEHTSDALRGVPGVLVRPSNHIGNDVTIRGCAPLVWIDGLRAKGAQIDEVTHGTDVAAIEVYESQAGVPAQYTDRSATCGTILVWLKD